MEELKNALDILNNCREVQHRDLVDKWTRSKSQEYEKTINDIATLEKALEILKRFDD